jgi:hypothetical protein
MKLCPNKPNIKWKYCDPKMYFYVPHVLNILV